jgi:hypothetical protein
MESTWEPQDLPVVLDAVVRYYNEHPQGQGVMLTCEQVAKLTGLGLTDVYRALKRLEPTYVRLVEGLDRSPSGCSVAGVTDAARRAVGQWPESVADGIVRELLAAADREPDEAKRTRLRVAADAMGGFGRNLLINVIANVATKPISF